jgi:hypothetical protein
MASFEGPSLVITSATWKEQAPNLMRTPTNLLDLVGWFGSTHASAAWRKEASFLEIFQKEQVVGFDPQIDDWEPSFARIEAEVLADASVLVLRLENNELLNGSLGSIAEIGLALTSAALRGQIVIVSIEEGLLTSLNEPGAIAQYMMLEMSLENVEKIPELKGLLRIHRGDDLQGLASMVCQAAQLQRQDYQTCLNFHDFLLKRARRRQNYPRRVLLGGSGGAYAKSHAEAFRKKKELLASAYQAEGQPVKILSEGAIAEAWKIPYGSVDNIGVALATRTLLSIENEFKREADLLLLPIMAEATSKAASTEIGFLLLYALTTGQDVKIYLEPFDPVDYIYHQLNDVDIQNCTDEKRMRLALQQAGVSSPILATATKEEVIETLELFDLLMQADKPSFKEVKKSLLGKTGAFLNADNAWRIRSLVQAHLERLDTDERFAGFFSYSTYIVV